MSEPFLVATDPTKLERVAARPLELDELTDEDIEGEEPERLRVMLALLPELERHLLLAHLEGRSHRRLALAIGYSSPAVTLRIQRARRRLAWLVEWPGLAVSREHVRAVCRRHLSYPVRRAVLAYWPSAGKPLLTQAAIGERFGIGQEAVHRRLVRASAVLDMRARDDIEAEPVAHGLVMLLAPGASYLVRDTPTKRSKRAMRRLAHLSTLAE